MQSSSQNQPDQGVPEPSLWNSKTRLGLLKAGLIMSVAASGLAFGVTSVVPYGAVAPVPILLAAAVMSTVYVIAHAIDGWNKMREEKQQATEREVPQVGIEKVKNQEKSQSIEMDKERKPTCLSTLLEKCGWSSPSTKIVHSDQPQPLPSQSNIQTRQR